MGKQWNEERSAGQSEFYNHLPEKKAILAAAEAGMLANKLQITHTLDNFWPFFKVCKWGGNSREMIYEHKQSYSYIVFVVDLINGMRIKWCLEDNMRIQLEPHDKTHWEKLFQLKRSEVLTYKVLQSQGQRK